MNPFSDSCKIRKGIKEIPALHQDSACRDLNVLYILSLHTEMLSVLFVPFCAWSVLSLGLLCSFLFLSVGTLIQEYSFRNAQGLSERKKLKAFVPLLSIGQVSRAFYFCFSLAYLTYFKVLACYITFVFFIMSFEL